MFGDSFDVQVREVTATRKEYESGLQQAVPGGIRIDGDSIFVTQGEVQIRIDIAPLPDLVIALMRLSRLQATWTFLSGTEEEKAALVEHMDWSMKRGGG